MKKNYALILLLICSFEVFGQVKISNNHTVMFEKRLGKYSGLPKNYDFLGEYNGNYYLLLDNKNVCKVSQDTKKVTTFETEELEEEILFNFQGDDYIGLISIKETKISLEVKKHTLNTSDNTLSAKTLRMFEVEKKSGMRYMTATSDDKSKKVAVVTEVLNKKAGYNGSFVFVFDETGDILTYAKIFPTFKGSRFSFDDVAVSNEGVVYLLASSTSYNKQGFIDASYLELLKIEDSAVSEKIVKQYPFKGVRDTKIKLLSGERIFITGYYKSSAGYQKEKKHDGHFTLMFDASLDDEGFTYKDYEPNTGKLKKKDRLYSKAIQSIHELSDGSIVVFGEERIITYIVVKYSSFYELQARNIVMDTYTPDGKHEKTQVIRKEQMIPSVSSGYYKRTLQMQDIIYELKHLPISFNVIKVDDKFLVFYNDHIENNIVPNEPKTKQLVTKAFKKYGVTVVCSIEEDVTEQKILIDAKAEERIFFDVLDCKDNEALILTLYNDGKVWDGVDGTLLFEKLTW
ncbi:MAG: hypothetical protein LBS16_07435 [Prevotellaceae bacterium]|nr:hypothetical protein [Prevotellaceae bacterium]